MLYLSYIEIEHLILTAFNRAFAEEAEKYRKSISERHETNMKLLEELKNKSKQ